MYAASRMARNLSRGDIAEGFFRLWWLKNQAAFPQLALQHHGYNPQGLVAGKAKSAALKASNDAPDFAAFVHAQVAAPALRIGISVNNQKALYHARQAHSVPDCVACARVSDCVSLANEVPPPSGFAGNLWFNRYNIEGDYVRFGQTSGADVILVSICSNIPERAWLAVEKAKLEPDLRQLILHGQHAPDLAAAIMHVAGRTTRPPRKYELRWLLHSQLRSGAIPSQAVTPTAVRVNNGWMKKLCVDARFAYGEDELRQFLALL